MPRPKSFEAKPLFAPFTGFWTAAAGLANSCAGCHGTDGHSPGAIPSIGGKSSAFIETAMKEFRSGERHGTVMGRHARAYTDEEIRLIAEFFGGEAQ